MSQLTSAIVTCKIQQDCTLPWFDHNMVEIALQINQDESQFTVVLQSYQCIQDKEFFEFFQKEKKQTSYFPSEIFKDQLL